MNQEPREQLGSWERIAAKQHNIEEQALTCRREKTDKNFPKNAETTDEQVVQHHEYVDHEVLGGLTNWTELEVIPNQVAIPVQGEKPSDFSTIDSLGVASSRAASIEKVMEQRKKREKAQRKKIKEFVILKLFREVKFVACKKMFDTLVRSRVEKGLNFPPEKVANDKWWYNNQRLVAATISEKRSNINSDMRRRYVKGM